MIKDIKAVIEDVSVFDDTGELCRWLEEYIEAINMGGAGSITVYYLEEIRQNLVGMNSLLQEIGKHYRMTEIAPTPE